MALLHLVSLFLSLKNKLNPDFWCNLQVLKYSYSSSEAQAVYAVPVES